MGRLAEALRENLREIAQSDARSLRAIDAELKAARGAVGEPVLNQAEEIKHLLGSGTFMQQTKASLQALCKKNGITGFWKLNKAGLSAVLKEKGVEPPPRSVEKLTKKELVALVKRLMK